MTSLHARFCSMVEKQGPAKVASRLGISTAMVSRLKNLKRSPSLGLAAKIARATKGPVTAWERLKRADES